jgi:hypothetical protein
MTTIIIMERKKWHSVRSISNANQKNVETETELIPLKHI